MKERLKEYFEETWYDPYTHIGIFLANLLAGGMTLLAIFG